ncbi:MAG: carbon-nitrogen hydrolase family protein [Rhodoplanes sp.]|uniref:carbon-nitrogen hydrolase family protein n=1 Tax=Rhodoplanes sp. TaxID=1968906 RepID=UPI00181628C2|nr:carbon-nitrogen hydrolase family protein [Rhodoplanes sp.]NVO15493.1 carbon-nitrogen hydrolase family protein [Rhodoplanes sp.]
MIVKAGVAQIGAVPFDNDATIGKVEQWIAAAGQEGCGLVLFPEALIPGYPKGSDYDISIGVRTERGRDEFRRYFDAAIDVPGPETERIGAAAAAAGMHVVIGVIERELGTVYCTALFFGSDGSLMGKHRKLMPTAGERLIWGYGDGSTLPVFDTPVGRLGAVICWENYMPMLRMAMYAKGVSVYCAPTADDRESWLPTMRHIAFEGRCFVLSACQVLRRGDFPADYRCSITDDPEALLMRGGSVIIDPKGCVLAGPVFDGEALLTADLDFDALARAKFDFDVAGHYARPDVFTLTVDETPRAAVRTVERR